MFFVLVLCEIKILTFSLQDYKEKFGVGLMKIRVDYQVF